MPACAGVWSSCWTVNVIAEATAPRGAMLLLQLTIRLPSVLVIVCPVFVVSFSSVVVVTMSNLVEAMSVVEVPCLTVQVDVDSDPQMAADEVILRNLDAAMLASNATVNWSEVGVVRVM